MRDKIKLVSSAGTGHYYTTTKNKRNQPEKMEIRKFDPVVRKHVAYKDAKIGRAHVNSSHTVISYAVFCLKKKKKKTKRQRRVCTTKHR